MGRLRDVHLQAMPRPSALPAGMNEEDALDAAIAQSLGLSGSPDSNGDYHGPGLDGAALPPEAGVSFANIAKMGFAATGPKLSPGAPEMGVCACLNGSAPFILLVQCFAAAQELVQAIVQWLSSTFTQLLHLSSHK